MTRPTARTRPRLHRQIRRPTKRGVQLEIELVKQVLRLLPSYAGVWGALSTFRQELGAGREIADVVLLIGSRDRARVLHEALSVAESVILSCLRRGGRTRIDALGRSLGVELSNSADGPLDRLRDWGLIETSRSGAVSLAGAWHRQGRIIALEAKLSRWRDALSQAARYRRYADESYVVLPGDRADVALRHRDLFVDRGVGLLVATPGALACRIKARASDEHDWRREFVLSRLVTQA